MALAPFQAGDSTYTEIEPYFGTYFFDAVSHHGANINNLNYIVPSQFSVKEIPTNSGSISDISLFDKIEVYLIEDGLESILLARGEGPFVSDGEENPLEVVSSQNVLNYIKDDKIFFKFRYVMNGNGDTSNAVMVNYSFLVTTN